METVIQELEETGLLVAHEGAKIVELGSNGNAIVCKSDGSMLYLSRDIAAAMQRFEEFQFDKMFYIVANQQTHHFKQVWSYVLCFSCLPYWIKWGNTGRADASMSTLV